MRRRIGRQATIRSAGARRLPFARWGLCELHADGLAAGGGDGRLGVYAVVVSGVRPGDSRSRLSSGSFAIRRDVFQQEPGLIVSPADGKVVEITPLAHHDFVGGPAVRIGIFLTIFNVHINRAPCRARVVRLHYSPGKFLNAMDPESAIVNENLWIGLEEDEAPHRRMVCRRSRG